MSLVNERHISNHSGDRIQEEYPCGQKSPSLSLKSINSNKGLSRCQGQKQSEHPMCISMYQFLVFLQCRFLHKLKGHSEHRISIIQLYINFILNLPPVRKFCLTLNSSLCNIMRYNLLWYTQRFCDERCGRQLNVQGQNRLLSSEQTENKCPFYLHSLLNHLPADI